MRTRSARKGIVNIVVAAALAFVFAICATPAGAVTCHEGNAIADITYQHSQNSTVKGHYFGEITYRNPLCGTPPMRLRARILRNSSVHNSQWVDGPNAVLGAHMSHDSAQYAACDGNWRATTEFGVRVAGIFTLLASDTSSIVYASCNVDDCEGPGECGGPESPIILDFLEAIPKPL